MRQNIKMVFDTTPPQAVYLYSHWDGDEPLEKSHLADKLRIALKRKQRWDDESYLARIIVSEVIKEYIDEETGYGIQPYEIDPEFPTIEVNFKEKTVNGIPFDKFVE